MNIPTTKELYYIIIAEFESEFTTTIPLTGKNYLRVQSAVLAVVLRLNYLFGAKVQKNIFADTAEPMSQGGTLERFGLVKLNRLPFPATAGVYTVNVTGQIGGVIEANQQFKSNDDSLNAGYLFVLDSQFTFTATTGQIQLRAFTGGLESQLAIGDKLTATNPIANVDQECTVATEDTKPLDAESESEYREQILRAFRTEAQGGAQGDFVLWATEVQGVSEAYPYTSPANDNTCDLYVEATTSDSTDGKGTPTTAILDAVEDAIENPTADRPSRKPVSMIVNYYPITPLNVTIEIQNFVDLTSDKQTLILNALTNYFADVRPFLGGVDVPELQNDTVTLNNISSVILEAIPSAVFLQPVMTVDGNTVASYTFENGDIPHLNGISYT